MGKIKTSVFIIMLLIACLLTGPMKGDAAARRFFFSIFPRCIDAKNLKFILDIDPQYGMIWVTKAQVDVGNGYTIFITPIPDSSGQITLQSKPRLGILGPGLTAHGKLVTFDWVDWNPSASNHPTYDGYTFLKTANKVTVYIPVRPNKYKFEFTTGHHYRQPNHETEGRDWVVSFCYKGPTFIPGRTAIKIKRD
jgi:hypothetical protein